MAWQGLKRGIVVGFVVGSLGALTVALTTGSGLLPFQGGQRARPAASTPEVPASSEAILATGARLYATHCLACHGDKDGLGRLPYVPSHGKDGHTWHHSDRNLLDIILNGSGDMGAMMREMMGVPPDAPRMPAWKDKLSEEEVKAILAYIKTFWTPEQRRLQQQAPMMP